MKKVIVCMLAYLMIVALSFKVVSADEGGNPGNEIKLTAYISRVYQQIDFGKGTHISFEAFDKAYRGYINLKNAGKLNPEHDILSICDFSLPSTENRLWIIDLQQKKVIYNTYVAHGQGSGDDMATSFSNRGNSHQSSLGFYVTGETYEGEHGTSLRLAGMDQGFNDAAFDRGIVVHGAEYVCDKFVCSNSRLGRSWGCPAVPAPLSLPIINTIKDGTCLYIYYPDTKYMSSAYWVNKKPAYLPENDMYASLLPPQDVKKPRTRTIKYITNGKLDSVVTMPITQKF
jgi:L,D-transpeptidase catalytic domain